MRGWERVGIDLCSLWYGVFGEERGEKEEEREGRVRGEKEVEGGTEGDREKEGEGEGDG